MSMLGLLEDFDLWAGILGFLITFLIAIFSLYSYKLSKHRNQLFFSAGFLLVALGWLAGVIFNTYTEFEERQVLLRGYVQLPYALGGLLMLHMLLIIAGYLTIFIVNEKLKSRKTMFLLYLFAVFSVLVAHDFYFLYHLTVFFILSLVVNHCAWLYKEQRSTNSLLILLGFSGLLLSHGIMMFTPFSQEFYVTGNFIQIISFAVLLWALVRIYKRKQ